MKQRWEIIADLINSKQYRYVAEVGVSRGINAAKILELCPSIVVMYLIDIDFSVFDTGLFSEQNRNKIKLEHNHFFLPDNLDLVFIDGEHTYEAVKKDIEFYKPKIRSGGIMAGHDYLDFTQPGYGVNQAVHEAFEVYRLEEDIQQKGLHVWWTYV